MSLSLSAFGVCPMGKQIFTCQPNGSSPQAEGGQQCSALNTQEYTVEVVKIAGLNFSAISIINHKRCCIIL